MLYKKLKASPVCASSNADTFKLQIKFKCLSIFLDETKYGNLISSVDNYIWKRTVKRVMLLFENGDMLL